LPRNIKDSVSEPVENFVEGVTSGDPEKAGDAFTDLGKDGLTAAAAAKLAKGNHGPDGDGPIDPYTPDRRMPADRDPNGTGNLEPESPNAHTQLGRTKNGTPQAREWGAEGDRGNIPGRPIPKKDIDFGDHGRRDHTNPHHHDYDQDTGERGDPEPGIGDDGK